MTRNFFRRVEALYPVHDPELKARIINEILGSEMKDNVDARMLQPDGTYIPVVRKEGDESFSAQRFFMAAAQKNAAAQLEVISV
jgi:polyphosphate kinase